MENEAVSPPAVAGLGDDDSPGDFTAESGNPETDVEHFRHCIDNYSRKAVELERKTKEVVDFYSAKKQANNVKSSWASKEKDKVVGHGRTASIIHNGNGSNSFTKKTLDMPQKEIVCTKRMQELMLQFGTIIKHITAHEWSRPFMDPVDVKGLGLHDYHKVIKRPMDFSTIKKQMEAKDGTGYKNVREIYADVRLIFTNAMKYNGVRSDVHVMAKTLLEKFEEKWLLLLPKVVEEADGVSSPLVNLTSQGDISVPSTAMSHHQGRADSFPSDILEARQKEEEARAVENMKIAQEAAFAKVAKETDIELDELNAQLEEMRDTVLQKCRRTSIDDKRKLVKALSTLTSEGLDTVLKMLSQSDSRYQTQESLEVDIDAQSESTLWKIKLYTKEVLEVQGKDSSSKGDEYSKRKKDIRDAQAKTAKKQVKKLLP